MLEGLLKNSTSSKRTASRNTARYRKKRRQADETKQSKCLRRPHNYMNNRHWTNPLIKYRSAETPTVATDYLSSRWDDLRDPGRPREDDQTPRAGKCMMMLIRCFYYLSQTSPAISLHGDCQPEGVLYEPLIEGGRRPHPAHPSTFFSRTQRNKNACTILVSSSIFLLGIVNPEN